MHQLRLLLPNRSIRSAADTACKLPLKALINQGSARSFMKKILALRAH